MSEIAFIKMHGLGNDFVVLDHLDGGPEITPELCASLADRRRGVGCDQVVVLLPADGNLPADLAEVIPPSSPKAHAIMRIHNADGSQAEMCGNAMRCVVRYLVQDRGIVDAEIHIATLAGMIISRMSDDGRVAVDMGEPRHLHGLSGQKPPQPLEIEQTHYTYSDISMGNPHCVIFNDDVNAFPLAEIGPRIETHSAFPNRTNVEFVQILDDENIRMRVWERGVGITEACGTGACAAAVAAIEAGRVTTRRVSVHLDGGVLDILWRASDGHVVMTGSATEVFRGRMEMA